MFSSVTCVRRPLPDMLRDTILWASQDGWDLAVLQVQGEAHRLFI